jgi:hypothetical protein
MSTEAFDWAVIVTAFIVALGVGSMIGAVVESYLERRREQRQRLPEPNCRARVVRRWGVPE